jgi:hypothetical protein
MPTLKRSVRNSRAVSLPRLDFDLYSGDVKLCEFIHLPSQSLVLAHDIVASTRELLETVEENDDEIAASERERLAVVADHLSEELAARRGGPHNRRRRRGRRRRRAVGERRLRGLVVLLSGRGGTGARPATN